MVSSKCDSSFELPTFLAASFMSSDSPHDLGRRVPGTHRVFGPASPHYHPRYPRRRGRLLSGKRSGGHVPTETQSLAIMSKLALCERASAIAAARIPASSLRRTSNDTPRAHERPQPDPSAAHTSSLTGRDTNGIASSISTTQECPTNPESSAVARSATIATPLWSAGHRARLVLLTSKRTVCWG